MKNHQLQWEDPTQLQALVCTGLNARGPQAVRICQECRRMVARHTVAKKALYSTSLLADALAGSSNASKK
jgi:hypothetical protein